MATPTTPPKNGFVAITRRIYNPLGFSKGYNFILFFIFAGAMLGFTLARLSFNDFHGQLCKSGGGSTLPGECYYYLKSMQYEIGIRIHLAAILPAGFLACFQFVPVIRHKLILFHRVNGYLVMILTLLGIAGALMIARHAAGGGLDTQSAIGTLTIMVVGCLALSYYNIKCLQIDQHRAWMLRAWFYLGTIITTRIIMIIAAQIISRQRNYFVPQPCGKVAWMLDDATDVLQRYPACETYFDGSDLEQQVMVRAVFAESVEQVASSLNAPFGMSLWVAIAMHAIGVETYLQLTPKESNRLRQVSYVRQLEAGFNNPGNAGLTVQRLGDADPFMFEKPETVGKRISNPSQGEM